MLWRSAKKPLTLPQEVAYRQHLSRLLRRWRQRGRVVSPDRYARLCANARCLALHPERLSSEHGWRMRRQRAAKACHEAQRAKGVTPGEAGREAIKRKRDDERKRAAGYTQAELRSGSANTEGV